MPQPPHKRKNRRIVFCLLLTLTLFLLPSFIARVKVLHRGSDSVVLEVTNISPDNSYASIAIIDAAVRNEGKVTFNRIEGELYIFRNDEVLYFCRAAYTGKVRAGEEKQVEFTVSNLSEAAPLLAYPAREMKYSWLPAEARFVGPGFMFTQAFGAERTLPWFVIGWPVLAACTALAGFLAPKKKKEPSGEAKITAPAEDPKAPSPAVDREAVESAQRDLENAGRMAASYHSQELTGNAELQEHFKRTAFGNVLRESTGPSGRDRDAFDSAKKSYEQASRFEASYRAGGEAQKQNAERAQYHRESAFAGMLEAVAGKDGRRSSDFESAKRTYESESMMASHYRASGSGANAAEAEHRQRLAYGNMLKSTSDLDKQASWDFSGAQRSYESESRSAASYRRQGLNKDAERAEHHMRLAEAKMLKVKAAAKGNDRAFEDARRDFENASRHYMEYKNQGLERDANREKDYMDRAYAKMMSYT